jgi:hypothetical protein
MPITKFTIEQTEAHEKSSLDREYDEYIKSAERDRDSGMIGPNQFTVRVFALGADFATRLRELREKQAKRRGVK